MRDESRLHSAGLFLTLAASVVLAGAAAVPASVARAQQVDARPTVAVLPNFNNGSLVNHADYDALGKGIADVLITELAANQAIRVVERDKIQQLMDEQNLSASGRVDPQTAVKVGKLLGVHHVILGGFIIDPQGRVRFDTRAVNVETGLVEHVESVTDKADNLLDVLSTMADKLNKGLKLPPMPGGAVRPALVPEATKPGRWRDLILYARAEDANDRKDRGQALALYKDFLDKSPATVLTAQHRRAEQRVRELANGS
jgi:TolB-like protein